jgi:hypothetical protein
MSVFFDKVTPVYDQNIPWDGYCQIQGVYLAARDCGRIDDFKECEADRIIRYLTFNHTYRF